MDVNATNAPSAGPSTSVSSPSFTHSAAGIPLLVEKAMAARTTGSRTASFIPLSSRSACRTPASRPGLRRKERSRTGSVDDKPAPRISASAG